MILGLAEIAVSHGVLVSFHSRMGMEMTKKGFWGQKSSNCLLSQAPTEEGPVNGKWLP